MTSLKEIWCIEFGSIIITKLSFQPIMLDLIKPNYGVPKLSLDYTQNPVSLKPANERLKAEQ
jgi:hypothetical protein